MLSKTLLFEEGGVVFYNRTTPFEKTIYQIPTEQLGRDISFSRTYHAPFFILPAFLSFLSIRLIIKKWFVGDWMLYLGLAVLVIICFGLMYYLVVGKKTGKIELEFGDLKLLLYLSKGDYLELKERLNHLK